MSKSLNLNRRIKESERKIKRDLERLERRGHLERGIVPPPAFAHRSEKQYSRKEKHKGNREW